MNKITLEDFKRFAVENDYAIMTTQMYSKAISALEQEPCDDAVSRQAVLDVWHTSYNDNREENEEIQYKKIAFDLPSVRPTCEEKEKGECPWYAR